MWRKEAWSAQEPRLALPSLPCFPLPCTRAVCASTNAVPRGRSRTWRWSRSRPLEAMQVKKPLSSELTLLITRAPSDCCLCLGNKATMPLSVCLGQDGTPASTDEAKPRARFCSFERRFSSSNAAGLVMQLLVLKSQHWCSKTLGKLAARADFWQQREGTAAPVAVEVPCRCPDLCCEPLPLLTDQLDFGKFASHVFFFC